MARVIVGMSGGVDSAVAALLLKTAGHDVIGVTLRTWIAGEGERNRCCELDDARDVADAIGIPYYVVNCLSEFEEKVTKPFADSYLCGKTPNPCVECNRYVKWEGMMKFAQVMHADLIATGHYASIIRKDNGRITVKRAAHAEKDQTYMLYRLSQEQLRATVMPLGELSKEEVRKIAENAGLPVAAKPDSQEICFIPDDDYGGYIERTYPGELPPEGYFVDEAGNRLGVHRGIIHYTVGQRRGLRLALGHPVYVKAIRPQTNEVVIAEDKDLYSDTVFCERLNFLGIPGLSEGEKLRCRAKIRSRHEPKSAVIEAAGPDRVCIRFDEGVRAPAPGQSAVFYDDDDCVIGGGIIV